jgi:hypothetical protein
MARREMNSFGIGVSTAIVKNASQQGWLADGRNISKRSMEDPSIPRRGLEESWMGGGEAGFIELRYLQDRVRKGTTY